MSDGNHQVSILRAIELVTAWRASTDENPAQMLDTLQRHLEEHPSGDPFPAAVELVMGMNYLCGSLLILRELESGVPPERSLQDLALEYARDPQQTEPG